MVESVVSKWGNSSAVRLPKSYLQELGIENNDTVKIGVRGNVITIEKPVKMRTICEIIFEETGLNLEEYVKEIRMTIHFTSNSAEREAKKYD